MKGKTDLKKQEIELLSPAGSYEGFEAAIGAGAMQFMLAVRILVPGPMHRILHRKS